MAFPIQGFHTFSDAISRDMWGISKNETTAGDGAISLAAQPVAGEARGQCLKLETATAGASDEAYFGLDLDYALTNGGPLTGDNSFGLQEGWFRLRFHWAAPTGAGNEGDTQILNFREALGTSALRVTLQANDATSFTLAFSQPNSATALGTSRTLKFADWHEVMLHWRDDGTFEAWTRTGVETNWTAETTTSPSAFDRVVNFRVGMRDLSWSGASNAALYVDDFAISHRSRSDVEPHRYIAGSGVRDANSAQASPVLIYPAGLFASASHARFTYSTRPDFASSSSTDWTALSGASNSALGLPVSGLSSKTIHYGRFEVATSADAGGIVYTSETYRFATLPDAGDDTAVRLGFNSCHCQESPAHPYNELEPIIDSIPRNQEPLYIGYYHYGDQGYEASQADSDYLTSVGEPPETEANFQQMQREFTSDIALCELMRAGVFLCQPDDHQWINDGDGTHAPGGSNEATLANDWSGEQTSDSYTPSLTVGELYVNGLAAFDDWWRHWTDEATGRYQAKTFGALHIIMLDTRTERIPTGGGATYLGATQLAWLKDRLDDFANDANAKTCLIITQSGWAGEFCKPSEGWSSIDATEYEGVVDYIYDSAGGSGVPPTKNVLILSGDDHSAYRLHDLISTTANPTMSDPIKGELKVSGGAIGFASYGLPTYSGNVLWSADTIPNFEMIRCSGALLHFSADGSGADAITWVQTENDDSEGRMGHQTFSRYTLFGDPSFGGSYL